MFRRIGPHLCAGIVLVTGCALLGGAAKSVEATRRDLCTLAHLAPVSELAPLRDACRRAADADELASTFRDCVLELERRARPPVLP